VTTLGDPQLLLDRLDGSGSDAAWAAIAELRHRTDLPELLLGKYRQSRRWSERAACVYCALPYARESSVALELGLLALDDKSKQVRYRATMLLAYAQRREALGPLRKLLGQGRSAEDASAAIDAIESKNHHYFVDREHSGMMTMNIVDAR
jgi:hypothetical protein